MKRIRPGREPAKFSLATSIFAVIFGLIWTAVAASLMGGAGILGLLFPLFGLCFVGLGIYRCVLLYRSVSGEEPLTLLEIHDDKQDEQPAKSGGKFCPYCGQALQEDFRFCPGCGRQLP